METFDLNDLVAESQRADRRWREFLRTPSLSMGLYRLRAGQAVVPGRRAGAGRGPRLPDLRRARRRAPVRGRHRGLDRPGVLRAARRLCPGEGRGITVTPSRG